MGISPTDSTNAEVTYLSMRYLLCAHQAAAAGASRCPTGLMKARIGAAAVCKGHLPNLTSRHVHSAVDCMHIRESEKCPGVKKEAMGTYTEFGG